jgi:subtilisin family serine protease
MQLVRVACVTLFLVLVTAPTALAGEQGHTALTPLPSVLPPTPLGSMHWSRGTRAPAAGSFEQGTAAIGVGAGVDGRELAAQRGLHVVEWLPRLRLVQVSGAPGALTALAGAGDPRIRYVEPVLTATAAHVRNDPLTYELDPNTGVPYEWQFHAVGTDQALNVTRGDPGILVGVLDTGVTPVRDLQGKIAETFWDKTQTTTSADALGHGTFVASIIAARNDDGFGLAGFCGACRLAVYKAPRLTNVQVAEGIRTLTDAHVRIINLSIVLDAPSQAVTDALNYAAAAGVLVVAAAGNEGQPTVDFPASYVAAAGPADGSGLAVGASDRHGHRASFSNSGTTLSLLAPGTFDNGCRFGVIGAIPANPPAFEDNGSCPAAVTRIDGARYAYESGTSYSTPEVAGTAALVWAAKPSLTSVQVASILQETATRPAGTGWTTSTGWGVLDASAAVASAAGRSTADVFALQGLAVSRPRSPGARVDAAVKARWADGTTVKPPVTVDCTISSAATPLHVSTGFADGRAFCSFTLPQESAGKLVHGVITLSAPGATTASASFRFTAKR